MFRPWGEVKMTAGRTWSTKSCWSWHLMTGGEWTHQALHFMIEQTGKFVLDCINFCCVLSTSERKETNCWKLQGTKARRAHGEQEVGNMRKMEINSRGKKRLVTSHMTTILSDGFAVQMRKSLLLPPLPPGPPEGDTSPRGEWLWHLMIWASCQKDE